MIHPQSGMIRIGTILSVFVQLQEGIDYILYITKSLKRIPQLDL